MFQLERSRYDGFVEYTEVIAKGDYRTLKDVQRKLCGGGMYYDEYGHEWYTEITKIEEEIRL